MICLSWNCRGLGHPAAIQFLRELVRVHRPNVFFLFETLSLSNKIEEVRVCLGYDCALPVNCRGHCGGLCLFWNNPALCTILNYSNNHVDVVITDDGGNWRFTGFYGHPKRSRRRESWGLLRTLANINQLPWVIMGDFNNLIASDEKKGGAQYPNWLIQGFRDAVSDCNISDLVMTGYPFTWSRGRTEQNLVEERLDRAMAKPSWHQRFPNATLKNLVAPISDHTPIVLNTNPRVTVPHRRIFRFENKWLEEADVGRVIANSWSGFRDFDLLRRLKATGEVLGDWGTHLATVWAKNKKDLEGMITHLQQSTEPASLERLTQAKKDLANLLIREDKHWKQRAKIHWLKGGDLNTKFFHQVASAQKKRKKIGGLFDENDIWVESQSEMENVAYSYFQNLFTAADNINDIEAVLDTMRSRISEEDALMLEADFDDNEFKAAVYQMHKDKSPDGFNPAFYKKLWGVVGKDIITACKQWLEEGSFPRDLNNTNVVLLPKCNNPKSMKDLLGFY